MGKRNGAKSADRSASAGVPEFKIVVTHPNRRGPLGPYRLTIAVFCALVVGGGPIWSTLSVGRADDGALIAAALAGLFVWVLTTVISTILGSAAPVTVPSPTSADTPAASG